jgi:hypothetical protein
MEIHETPSWESMSKKLEISQRDEPQFQRRADRLTSVRGVQFPKEVVKMRLNRRHSQAKLLSQPLGWQTLGHTTKDLHFPRGQMDRFCCA